MIFDLKEKTLYRIYYCPVCNGHYIQKGNADHQVQCTVAHQPGTCCHYSDRPVDYAQREKIEEAINWLPGKKMKNEPVKKVSTFFSLRKGRGKE
jgi:hypothetical protein